mgnify:CR=1 FL=1
MRSRQSTQNWLYCTLIGILGLYASTYQTIVSNLTEHFGMDARMMGVLLSVYAAGSLFSVLISGMVSDSIGKRRVVLISTVIMVLGLVCVATSGSVAPLFLGLFLTGMGFGPSESIGSALLTDENPGASTRWMNISQIFFGVGAIAAPLAVTWYLTSRGGTPSGVLLICAAAAFVCWALMAATSGGRLKKPEGVKRELNMFSVLKNREFLLYAVMVFLYLCYEGVAPSYFKQLFLERGASEATSSLAISVFWAAMVLFRMVGVFMDGKEHACIRYLTPLVIVGVAVALLAENDWLRLAGVVLYGFGCGPVWPMLFVLAARVFPQRSGAAYATMMLFSMAGNSIAPALIGSAVNNVQTTFVLCAAIALVVTACGWYASKKYA